MRATKYCCPVFQGDFASRASKLLRQVCSRFEIQIQQGVASKGYVHILVSASP
ncbi:transposase [Solidesulfovibrio aerotolerans]|uniref:transposase n=1 Tax=Solidesulfovibrio aerotolerans TaxID=295255 RepID=UPI0031B5651C